MIKRFGIPSGTAIATAALTLVLLPAGAPAAVHTQANALIPVKFGLPGAKEGQSYRFSIAGAATGGVKPYHCTPAVSFGPLWAWLHVASSCVLSGTAPILPAGHSNRMTELIFKLTDSETPPKTVTLYPMLFAIHSKTEEYPFDGTYKVTLTFTSSLYNCTTAGSKTTKTSSEFKVVNGMYRGKVISVDSALGTGHVRISQVIGPLTLIISLTFRRGLSDDTQISVSGLETESGPAGGCTVKGHGTIHGSRVSISK